MEYKIIIIVFLLSILAMPVLAADMKKIDVSVASQTEAVLNLGKNTNQVLGQLATSSLEIVPGMTIETLKKEKAEKLVLQDMLKNKTDKVYKNNITNQYHEALMKFMQGLLVYSENHRTEGEAIREIIKIQADTENVISPLLDKMKQKNKVWKFFFGTNLRDAKLVVSQLDKASRNLKNLELIREKTVDPNDWEAIGKIEYLLKENIDIVSDEVKTEESALSLFGWVKKIFV